MATRLTRERRSYLGSRARETRSQLLRDGWTPEQIALQIVAELPEVLPLEAYRWAYGWSRADVVMAISRMYLADQLMPPGLSEAMLCKWEHGQRSITPQYVADLCRLYRATPGQLGLPVWARHVITRSSAGYGAVQTPRDGAGMADTQALAALRESITLMVEVEGPGGGVQTHTALTAALSYYDRNYSKFPPALLASEVYKVRRMVQLMLAEPQPDLRRRDSRQVAGWLTALLGNLAFHLDDPGAAALHLATATSLGADVGDNWLVCWTLGARAMIAHYNDDHTAAIEHALHALELADTPLREAQMLTWGLLRPTAALGRSAEAASASRRALTLLEGAEDLPGRFGFDLAEAEVHLGEGALLAGDAGQARMYAEQSISHIPHGRPGWAAAQVVLARAQVARGQLSDGAALGLDVLDVIPAEDLRATTRARLVVLADELQTGRAPISEARQFTERLAALPSLPGFET